MSTAAVAVARDCGFEGICSAFGGFNFPGDDAFHLQRIHADADLIRLKNWLTVDPRKLQESRQFAAATQALLQPAADAGDVDRRAADSGRILPGSAGFAIDTRAAQPLAWPGSLVLEGPNR